MRPYLLFIAMIAGGIVITALLGSTMDAHVLAQEQRREQAYQAN